MIVPMKRLTLLCAAPQVARSLEALRELGCVHLDATATPSPETAAAGADLASAEQAVRILDKAYRAHSCTMPPAVGDDVDVGSVAAILKVDARMKALAEEADKWRRQVAHYAPWGDFDPALVRELLADGVDLAAVAEWPDPLPPVRLSEMQRRLAACTAEAAALEGALARARDVRGRLVRAFPALRAAQALAAARDEVGVDGEIAWIQGWMPQDAVPAVRARAVKEGWGLALRDPEPGETPPTAIRPPRLFRPVAALFAGLGIAPAYSEADVSVPFMCYFSLFFAMLVGDGGYGALLLAAAFWGWHKTKPPAGEPHRPRLVRAWLTLLTVFSTATVAWGVLSNTWFGAAIPVFEPASGSSAFIHTLARASNAVFNGATVAWLGDPTYAHMMLLCFTIGASHLILARLWSAVCVINDRTCLAQFGWAGIVLFMYLVTNAIVGIFPSVPAWSYWVFGVSLVLVFGFTLKGSELRTRGIELGMLPLNIMSALGDIISYVRLFAVGLASVKVAQNFNEMALGLDLPPALKIVPMVLILLVGHGLNFAMAGLSILVHAVRLNTLEFSNHKGITWAGYAFRPFARRA